MRKLILALALAYSAAGAMEVKGDTIILTPQEVASLPKCEEQGGCHIVTVEAVNRYVEEVIRRTLEEAARMCKARDRNAI